MQYAAFEEARECQKEMQNNYNKQKTTVTAIRLRGAATPVWIGCNGYFDAEPCKGLQINIHKFQNKRQQQINSSAAHSAVWMASGTKWSAKPVCVCRERRSLSSAMRRCCRGLPTHSLSRCVRNGGGCVCLPSYGCASACALSLCECACASALPALSRARVCVLSVAEAYK